MLLLLVAPWGNLCDEQWCAHHVTSSFFMAKWEVPNSSLHHARGCGFESHTVCIHLLCNFLLHIACLQHNMLAYRNIVINSTNVLWVCVWGVGEGSIMNQTPQTLTILPPKFRKLIFLWHFRKWHVENIQICKPINRAGMADISRPLIPRVGGTHGTLGDSGHFWACYYGRLNCHLVVSFYSISASLPIREGFKTACNITTYFEFLTKNGKNSGTDKKPVTSTNPWLLLQRENLLLWDIYFKVQL